MQLSELIEQLKRHPDAGLAFVLPDDSTVALVVPATTRSATTTVTTATTTTTSSYVENARSKIASRKPRTS